jgi:hypothetical protein
MICTLVDMIDRSPGLLECSQGHVSIPNRSSTSILLQKEVSQLLLCHILDRHTALILTKLLVLLLSRLDFV